MSERGRLRVRKVGREMMMMMVMMMWAADEGDVGRGRI